MPASHRQQILMDEWEVTMSQILTAIMEIQLIQEDRMKTARSAFRRQRSREAIQSARKKLGKMFRRRIFYSKRRKTNMHELPSIASFRNIKEYFPRSIESDLNNISGEECLFSDELEDGIDFF